MVENPTDAYVALLLQAEAYHNLGQTPQSLEPLGKAIKLDPVSWELYFIRGRTYRLLGQLNLAINDLTRAIGLDPQKGGAYYTRALAYTQLGRHAEAGEDIERAVNLGVDQNSLMAAIEELKDSP